MAFLWLDLVQGGSDITVPRYKNRSNLIGQTARGKSLCVSLAMRLRLLVACGALGSGILIPCAVGSLPPEDEPGIATTIPSAISPVAAGELTSSPGPNGQTRRLATYVSAPTWCMLTSNLQSNYVVTVTQPLDITGDDDCDSPAQITSGQTGLVIDGSGLTVSGGGAFRHFVISQKSEVTIRNISLENGFVEVGRYHGGSISISDSVLVLTHVTLRNNTGTNGGAMRLQSGAQVTILHSLITENTGAVGGGINAAVYSELTMSFTTVSNNDATNGGGIAVLESRFDLTQCDFFENVATTRGGAVYIDTSDIIYNTTIGTMTACDVFNNTAGVAGDIPVGRGGGISSGSRGGELALVGSRMSGNTQELLANGGSDVFLSAALFSFSVYSSCVGGMFNTGAGGLLDCSDFADDIASCSSLPSDLSGACSPCSEGQRSCCGALACTSLVQPTCSIVEESLCAAPTSSPSYAPSHFPTFPPSVSSPPTLAPSPIPTPKPSPVPTLLCMGAGTYFDGSECHDCEIGKFSTTSSPPWPRSCTYCPAGQ